MEFVNGWHTEGVKPAVKIFCYILLTKRVSDSKMNEDKTTELTISRGQL